jgi:hypothetical protein
LPASLFGGRVLNCRQSVNAAGFRLGVNNLPDSLNRNPHRFHQSLLDVVHAD